MKRLDRIANVALILALVVLVGFLGNFYWRSHHVDSSPQAIALTGSTVHLSGMDFTHRNKTLLLAISPTCHFCRASEPFYRPLVETVSLKTRLVARVPVPQAEAETFVHSSSSSREVVSASLDDVHVDATPTTPAPIAFEVATIKPVMERDWANHGPHPGVTHASYRSMTVQSLFAYAYRVGSLQISCPKWVSADSYDIEAEIPEGAPPGSDRAMLQTLLKDRFQLRFHTEKSEQKVYVLVVGKDGSRLKRSDPLATADNAPLKPGERIIGQGRDKSKVLTALDANTDMMHVEDSRVTMKEFSTYLSTVLVMTGNRDEIVVDGTGLDGDYQVALDFPMASMVHGENASGASASDPVSLTTLTNSLGKLGLRLEKQKAQVDSYVIDHAEKPSEN